MGIPVVDILTELTREDTLLGAVGLGIVAGPSVNDIIIVADTGRIDVGSGSRTVGIGIFVLRYL